MPIVRRTRLFNTACGAAWFCWLWSCGAGTSAACTLHTRPDRPRDPPSLLCDSTGSFFPGVKLPFRGVDHQPTYSAEVKETVKLYLYHPHPSLCLLGILQMPIVSEFWELQTPAALRAGRHEMRWLYLTYFRTKDNRILFTFKVVINLSIFSFNFNS